MNDGANFPPGLEYISMKAPLTRGSAAPEPAAVKIHQRDIVVFERVIGHSAGTDEKSLLIAPQADVA